MRRRIGCWVLPLLLVMLTGAVDRAAHAQDPVVDRSTHHTQDGLTLLAITRGDSRGMYQFPVPAGLSFLSAPTASSSPGMLALWIKSSKPLPPPQPGRPTMLGMPGGSLANTSVQLQAMNVGGYASHAPQTLLYVLFVPGGYPPQTHALEVTFTDGRGHTATWTLVHLPPPDHAVPPTAPLKTAFVRPGVMLKAVAWHDNGVRGTFTTPLRGVDYRITATAGAGPGWAVRVKRTLLEWEGTPPSPVTPSRFGGFYGSPPPFLGPHQGRRGPGSYVAAEGLESTPYGDADHRLRLDCDLIRLATTAESLTFHNLNVRPDIPPQPPMARGSRQRRRNFYAPPVSSVVAVARPQTVTTPSGAKVTLLPMSDLPQNRGFYGGFPGSVTLLLRFSGAAPNTVMPVSLPHSPLFRAYHRPVTLAITAASPLMLQNVNPVFGDFTAAGQSAAPGEYVVTLINPTRPPPFHARNGRPFVYTPPTPPKFLPSLTLILTQTAMLQSQPVSFVVPIQSAPPPIAGVPPAPRLKRR